LKFWERRGIGRLGSRNQVPYKDGMFYEQLGGASKSLSSQGNLVEEIA